MLLKDEQTTTSCYVKRCTPLSDKMIILFPRYEESHRRPSPFQCLQHRFFRKKATYNSMSSPLLPDEASSDGMVNRSLESKENQKSTSSASSPMEQSNGPSYTPRSAVGQAMDSVSTIINDNLITFRYGAMASITLLTAYGLSNTPLFFRYRTVQEIPSSFFVGRRHLYCRIIRVDRHSGIASRPNDTTVQILVRNLSPIGLLLPASWFDFLMRISPSSRFTEGLVRQTKPEENKNELLRIQIAGIHTPPVSRLLYNPDTFLDRLAEERTLVRCQLLGRTAASSKPSASERMTPISAPKPGSSPVEQPFHGIPTRSKMDEISQALNPPSNNTQQLALCRLTYRPKVLQLFSTDIAETLIKAGNACVSSTMMGTSSTNDAAPMKIVDSSQRLQDLRNDVKYLDRLAQTELEAAKKSAGMWSVPDVRKMKREVVEEVDFQMKANVFQKLWRWLRSSY